MNEYIRGLKSKGHPGYFVATVRTETLENNPDLKNWLENEKAKLIEVPPFTQKDKGRLIDNIKAPSEWKEKHRQTLIEATDGTPAHIITTFNVIKKKGFDHVSHSEIRQIASDSLRGTWNTIRSEIQKLEPASESLIKALAVFHHTGVTPVTELVFALAEFIQKAT